MKIYLKVLKSGKKTNPKVIPRNHLVEKALENVGNGEMIFLNDFLKVLKNPYETPYNKMYTEGDIDDLYYKTFCGT